MQLFLFVVYPHYLWTQKHQSRALLTFFKLYKPLNNSNIDNSNIEKFKFKFFRKIRFQYSFKIRFHLYYVVIR